MNPWQQQGVSILPKNLKDLLPLVGQKSLFDDLQRFKKSCLAESSSEKLAGFFVLHGGWGVGKSRVGHELCLEAVSDQVDWIVDTEPQRILDSGLADGILPLFTRYIHVTNGPLGDQLNAENWIPMVAVEALSALLKSDGGNGEGDLKRNQDRLIQHTIQALKPKGWDKHKAALALALETSDLDQAAKQAIEVLGKMGIKSLWVVVDEIEDITDVDRDGIKTDERQPIKQELLPNRHSWPTAPCGNSRLRPGLDGTRRISADQRMTPIDCNSQEPAGLLLTCNLDKPSDGTLSNGHRCARNLRDRH